MKGPITRFLLGCALLLYKREVNVLGLTLKNSKIVGDLLTDGFLGLSYAKCNFREDLTLSWPACIAMYA